MKKILVILVALTGFGINVNAQSMCGTCNGLGIVRPQVTCTPCGGQGGRKEYEQRTCSYCSGRGSVSQTGNCGSCRGSGKTPRQVSEDCFKCSGTGSLKRMCERCQGSGTMPTAPQRRADGTYGPRGTAKCNTIGCNNGYHYTRCSCSGGKIYKTVQDNCGSCYGSGKTNTTVTCSGCSGRGTTSVAVRKTCGGCNGRGTVISQTGYTCSSCNGTGKR